MYMYNVERNRKICLEKGRRKSTKMQHTGEHKMFHSQATREKKKIKQDSRRA